MAMNALVLSTFRNPLVDGWDSLDLRNQPVWRLGLDPRARNEVARHLLRHGGAPADTIRKSEFPALAALASTARAELASGTGIAWIRPSNRAGQDRETAGGFLSIFASLLGMAHRSIDLAPAAVAARTMSTDVIDGFVPDVVGATWLDDAEAADELHAVSAAAVHDEILETRPDCVRALYRTVLHLTHRLHDDPNRSGRSVRAPIYRYERSARSLEFRYSRARILAAHELSGHDVPAQVLEAFDVLDKTMTLSHLVATIRPRCGDLVFVHNRRVATSGLIDPAPGSANRQVRALRVVDTS
ncbi:MAG: hypothetical protein ACR2P0_07005 [Acidimicrobiales bacterium]